jgi:amidase
VKPTPPPVDVAELLRAFDALVGAESSRALTPAAHHRRRLLRPAAGALQRLGARAPGAWPSRILASTESHHAWMRADEARGRLRAHMAAAFQQWDVLACPCAPTAAFPHDDRPMWRRRLPTSDGRRLPYHELARWSALASALGLPATAVPAGFTATGLPVGVQLVGPAGGDSRTLAVAEAVEAEVGGWVAPPGPTPEAA